METLMLASARLCGLKKELHRGGHGVRRGRNTLSN
jgi:hypothetical protein